MDERGHFTQIAINKLDDGFEAPGLAGHAAGIAHRLSPVT
jgi:hypothetical protein